MDSLYDSRLAKKAIDILNRVKGKWYENLNTCDCAIVALNDETELRLFICQNQRSGLDCHDKKGFRHSYCYTARLPYGGEDLKEYLYYVLNKCNVRAVIKILDKKEFKI